ncbi:MAG: type II toxin-antitoxin system VapC family toxin [Pyrinomonadaceae bacterium]
MSILLDTHVFIWAAEENRRLSAAARAMLSDPNEVVFFSAVSSIEIAIKWSKGNLELPAHPYEFISNVINASGMSQLALSVRDSCAVGDLPFHHNDPFDRLLVAQARSNGLRLMTADPILERYNVDLIALWLNDDDE